MAAKASPNYWLMKSEPDTFSIQDLKKKGRCNWDGVRNYTCRNFLRDGMKPGDLAFFYHSSCPEPGIAGTMKVVRGGSPDPSQFDKKSKYFDPKALPTDPRWFMVEMEFRSAASRVLSLQALREAPQLKKMELLRLNRLSITPVRPGEWAFIEGILVD
jgi:predicted RNA-binding protein with PUA-like domain